MMATYLLTNFYFTMKKPKDSNIEKSATKAKIEKPAVAAVAKEPKTKKASPSQKVPTKSETPKPAIKVKAEQPVSEAAPEIAMPQRIGLTAGSIWHYLSKNGVTPVAKLSKELPEEEKVIQRSIGWLAQEGKIKLAIVDRVETIALKK